MHGWQSDLLEWFDEHARDLPWREPSASPWAVMVSEFMLQQTPVSRVLPAYDAWIERWPTPAALASSPAGEAIRMWGRLGYPRRALRLHAAAVAIVAEHGGEVPVDHDELLALPGVGAYTAAAISAFAFDGREPVLDTNVRRVYARALGGAEFPGTSPTRAERDLAAALVPDDHPGQWAVAVMELGALVCTAAKPSCGRCPIRTTCAWHAAGRPAYDGPPRRGQTYAGTDRQCRGRLLAVLRDSDGSVAKARLDAVWSDIAQRERALETLIADGLIETVGDRYALPS
ncbi:MAG TPA: A/G-specific adenine glycosylase [Marmoricola sp.]